MSQPDILPLPIYVNFLPKAHSIAAELLRPPREVAGAILLLWLYATLNGEESKACNGPYLAPCTRGEIDRLLDITGLAALLEKRGWIEFDVAGVAFPGLKRYESGAVGAEEIARLNWFNEFWEAFEPGLKGVKGSKAEARKMWLKIKGMDEKVFGEIMAGLKKQVSARWPMSYGTNPHAVRWLRHRMWEDADQGVATATTRTGPQSSQNGPQTRRQSGAPYSPNMLEIARQRAREAGK